MHVRLRVGQIAQRRCLEGGDHSLKKLVRAFCRAPQRGVGNVNKIPMTKIGIAGLIARRSLSENRGRSGRFGSVWDFKSGKTSISVNLVVLALSHAHIVK